MDEEIWRAYLESLSVKELRSSARRLGLRIDGFRKDHQKTPGPILINHFARYPAVAQIMPGLVRLRKKIEEQTGNEAGVIAEKKQQFFAEYGEVPTIAALVSTEEKELMELGELWFGAWLKQREQKKEEQVQDQEIKLERKVQELEEQITQLEKKLKKAEKSEKDWKGKYESLKTKKEKERERWKKKSTSYENKLAIKEEEVVLWQEKCEQLESKLTTLELEREQLEQELNQSCREVLIIGEENRPQERKRIGSELVNLLYIDSNKQNGLSELVQEKDYIFLQSATLPNPLRTNIYTWCLRAGKQPLEISGEEDLTAKLERVLGAGK